MNREDYKKSQAAKKMTTSSVNNYLNDFKLALAAMIVDDNYKVVESQLFGAAGK